MSSAFYTLVGAIVVLGVMILVHEFGHFAAAKLLGVRVEVFSLGFGKRLFGFRRGETDYRISALPLGGYVKMTGVNAIEMPEERPEGATDQDEFLRHPRWQRLIIAVAGPAANVVLAVVLLTAVFTLHHEIPYGFYQPAVVGWCLPGSAAAQAGLKEGDQIVQIGDIQNPIWQDVQNKVLINPNQPLALRVKRGDEVLPITLVPKAEGKQQSGDAGWLPAKPFLVTALEKDMPGAMAGLHVGDEIVAVDGKAIHATGAMQTYLQATKDKPVHLEVLRQNAPVEITVTPKLAPVEEGPTQSYRIGFVSEPMQIEKLPVSEAFSRSVDECKKLSGLIFELIGRMAERKVSVKQMSGPIEIVRVSGEMVHHRNANDLMEFMAMISLQLGLFNLLPIPILDGGLIAMLLVESVMRRDINEAIKIRLYQAAFVCLVLFAGMVIFNDVVKMLPGQ